MMSLLFKLQDPSLMSVCIDPGPIDSMLTATACKMNASDIKVDYICRKKSFEN